MTNGGVRGARPAPTLELDCDGSQIRVQAQDVIVGRTGKCTVRVVHPLVSREHCRIEPRGDGLFVVDLGSINGTWLNGVRISNRAQLRTGDRIGLGREGAVLVVKRALVAGVDVAKAVRQEDQQTMIAGDARAAGAVARIDVAPHAVPVMEPTTRTAGERQGSIPVVAAMETAEVSRERDADRTAEVTPIIEAAASHGFAPGLAAGFVLGLAAIGALLGFTHLLDPIRPAVRETRTR